MDVRNWSMDQILMLPDHCLSRRYSVFVTISTTPLETEWDISELALPDKAIIHEFGILCTGGFGKLATARLALGDQLPIATATMDALEPLFMGLGRQGAEPRTFQVGAGEYFHLDRLKMYVPAQGRRLILETTAETGVEIDITAVIVVSACPTEVPDCLLSV